MTTPETGWDGVYQAADAPPWEIGRPQPVFAALAEQGLLAGDLLDAGCGTGENALMAATHGAAARGVDLSRTAIDRARAKALDRGVDASFEAGDILDLPLPADGFDTVIDSGLFHSFNDVDRARYVDTLARVIRPGGHCYLMCFSDRQPGDWGPRRVTRAELEAAFADGWAIERIEPARFEINPFAGAEVVAAWLVAVRRD